MTTNPELAAKVARVLGIRVELLNHAGEPFCRRAEAPHYDYTPDLLGADFADALARVMAMEDVVSVEFDREECTLWGRDSWGNRAVVSYGEGDTQPEQLCNAIAAMGESDG